MDFYEKIGYESRASEWAEIVEKEYARYGVSIELRCIKMLEERFIYEVRLKKQTRIKHIFDKQDEVKLCLKFPLFILGKTDGMIFLALSDKKIEYPHLTEFLDKRECRAITDNMKLPYLVGFDISGSVVLEDVEKQPHILLGGSTSSGKTVGLKSLISAICYLKSPVDVNMVLIDLGANDLRVFNGLPHLSCPVVNEREKAYCVLKTLDKEMKRRKELEVTDRLIYEKLPSLVVVIDEFPDLFSVDLGKKMKKEVIEIISNMLRRGRHFNIHIILAAQNPTIQNMKVDLGNVTTRIAFKSAKRNFSEVILGEAGAENLMGKGDLLLKSCKYGIPLRVQGVNITDEELRDLTRKTRINWKNVYHNPNKFRASLEWKENNLESLGYKDTPRDAEFEEKLLENIIKWGVLQEKISCNQLQKVFGIGWNRASIMMENLQTLGMIESLDAKLPRTVLVRKKEDITEDMIKNLKLRGISEDLIAGVFQTINTQQFLKKEG